MIYNCLWGWELSSPKCVMVETEKGIYRATAAENGSMEVLVSREFVEEVLEIGVLEYPNSRILLQQGETAVMLEKGSPIMRQGLNSQVLRCGPPAGEETVCLPLEAVCRGFGYRVRAVPQKGRICLEPENPYRSRRLPESYDYRKVGRGARSGIREVMGPAGHLPPLPPWRLLCAPRLPGSFPRTICPFTTAFP